MSKSVDLAYGVRSRTTKSLDLTYGVRIRVATSGSALQFAVRARVSQSEALVYGVRRFIYPGKVFSLVHGVRKVVSRSASTAYYVLVPISSGGAFSSAFSSAFASAAGSTAKEIELVYGVKARVSKSVAIQYDVAATTTFSVSKPFTLLYATLVVPTVDEIITIPIAVDQVPPQIRTTSL